jgi:RNA polymerase sigma-B factor
VHPLPESPTQPPEEHASRRAARNERVLAHVDLVERYVRRYSLRGVPVDDLRQASYLALVEAAERFDPDRGDAFEAFASVTIDGSLKRYFRDRTWAVRPPRALLELHLRVRQANDDLRQRLGREPTIADLAAEVGVDEDHVYEALEASSARWNMSLDAPPPGDDGTAGPSDGAWLETVDPGFEQVEWRSDLHDALADLDDDARELIRLRFVENCTQSELSERLGLSQSYVSRVIRGVLDQLQRHMEDGGGPPRSTRPSPARSRTSGAR